MNMNCMTLQVTSSYSKARAHVKKTTPLDVPSTANLVSATHEATKTWEAISALLSSSMATTIAKKLNLLREPRRTTCEVDTLAMLARHLTELEIADAGIVVEEVEG